MKKKKRVPVFNHDRLPHGDFAYYQNGEIHILSPKALYRRVLKHEIGHSQMGHLARATDFLLETVNSPVAKLSIFLALILMTGYFLTEIAGSRILFLGVSILGAMFFLVILGQAFYWAEEIRVKREERK